MAPDRGLPMSEPARLRDHKLASEVWRRSMRVYAELESTIVTRLDMDLLVDYCMLMEQLSELDLMRRTTYKQWLELGVAHDKAIQQAAAAQRAADEAVQMAKETGGELPEKGSYNFV